MSQCVPSWDLEDKLRDHHPQSSHSLPHDVPTLDYEVAELRWENGQPSILGLPRAANKYPQASSAAVWDNPPHSSATGDTLESVVNQATTRRHKQPSAASELVPWYDHHHHQEAAVDVPTMKSTTHTRAFLDALVPCGNKNQNNRIIKEAQQHSTAHVPAGISTCMVSSCSVARTQGKLDLSEGGGGRDHRCRHPEAVEGSEYVGGGGFTSELSPENTSSGGREYTRSRTSGDDSVCHSMSQRETGDEEIVKKRSTGKSSVSTKRSRAAAIHNQSERRRRDKINQRMKTLQKLVPNSSKTDKASMLDEVIEYLKQLQAQVYLMSRTTTPSPPMMLPFMQQHQLQMPNMNMMMPPPLGMGMGLGFGSIMDFNAMTRAAAAGAGHAIQPNATFMPSAIGSWDNSSGDRLASTHDALSAFLACQMQPMTMDTYSRLAALYQQFQQPPPCGSKD